MNAVLKQSTAIIAPDPFGGRKVEMTIPAGLTITQVVAQAIANDNLPPRWSAEYFRVYVGGEEIPSAWWSRTRLKPGSHLAIVTAPRDGKGAGKVFRTLLIVAVIALTAWVGGGALIGLLGAGTLAAGSVGAALAAAGVSLIGGVILNALAPSQSSASAQSQAFSLQGAQNAAKPYQAYPVVLGRRRVVPPLAAATWTETVDDDVYLNMMLAWHMGPCAVSDIKIGETPISEYDGVIMQHRLLPGDSYPTFYPRVIREEPLQNALTHAVGWVERTTQRKTTRIDLDLGFPTGLLKTTGSGNSSATVQVHVQYRATGSGTWLNAPVGSAGVVTYTENKSAPFRRNMGWVVDEGQYDIQIQRVTADDTSTSMADDVYWVALRSVGDGLPVINPDLAITALRIKSSAQLNGILDNLNGVVQMYAPKWDGSAFTGLDATRNPGEIANWIALGAANARPLTDRVDVAQLGAWTERCTAKSWNCDHIIDNGGTVEQALQIVAGCGRGFGAIWFDGKLAVAVDDQQDTPVQVFSARNVRNFSGTISFPGALHAVNVNFNDEDNGFQPATRTVFADGYDDSNATLFETIDATGKTNPGEAWVTGWRYLAGRTLRPEVYEFDTAMQGLCVRIGQRAEVSHYRMSVGICGARITGLEVDDDGNVYGLILDETVIQEFGKTYVFRVQSGSSIQLLALTTIEGTSNVLLLASGIPVDDAPEVGDHGVFGESGKETLATIVIGISTKAGKDGHIMAIPYAPDLLADGGDIPDWDPLITPRIISGTPLGLHVPGTGKVTNDNVIQTINIERGNRAAGDSANADAIDATQAQVDLHEAAIALGKVAQDAAAASIRGLFGIEHNNAAAILNLSVAFNQQAKAVGSAAAYANQTLSKSVDSRFAAEAQARLDLAAIVTGLTTGDTETALAARLTIAEDTIADLTAGKASTSDLAILNAQINTPTTGIAAQVSTNTAAIALLDPSSSTATIQQTAAAARAQGLQIDKLGETLLEIMSALQNNAKKIAVTLAFVTTTITASVTDGQSALARSIADTTAMLQTADLSLQSNIDSTNTASVTRDLALTDSLNTAYSYFGSGIDGSNTVAAKLSAEAGTRAAADLSAVTRLNALEASVNTPTTGLLALVATQTTAIADLTTNKASASSVAALSAQVNTPTTGIAALVSSQGTAIADLNTNKASASVVSALSSTVGGHTTDILNLTSSVNGIYARWGVSINTDGAVTGFINLDGTNGSTNFTVAASNFYFRDTAGGAQPMFSISGGVAKFSVPLKAGLIDVGTVIADNIIVTSHLQAGTVTDFDVLSSPIASITASSELNPFGSGSVVAVSVDASSKVLLQFSGSFTRQGGTSPLCKFRIYRNGTSLALAESAVGGSGIAEAESFVVTVVDKTPMANGGNGHYYATAFIQSGTTSPAGYNNATLTALAGKR